MSMKKHFGSLKKLDLDLSSSLISTHWRFASIPSNGRGLLQIPGLIRLTCVYKQDVSIHTKWWIEYFVLAQRIFSVVEVNDSGSAVRSKSPPPTPPTKVCSYKNRCRCCWNQANKLVYYFQFRISDKVFCHLIQF